jgi:hypothetical protein
MTILNPINKTLRNDMDYGTQNWNRNSKDDYEVNEFKTERLEKILKKLKNGKASWEVNIPSEL